MKAQRAARLRAPVLTGFLRRNIRWQVLGTVGSQEGLELRLGDLGLAVPYLRRWEFEHKSRRYYLRRALRSVASDIASAERAARIRTRLARASIAGPAALVLAASRRNEREAQRRSRRETVRANAAATLALAAALRGRRDDTAETLRPGRRTGLFN